MALKGIKVIEIAGLAPAPLCGMILSDFGAQVIRVDKTNTSLYPDPLGRGKRSIRLNLKHENGRTILHKLSNNADVLLEPFRAGVMEKLQLGPEILMKENPRLIYARLTGYGQNGPLAQTAGHDINYISIAGLLSAFGFKNEKPLPPLNILADFAGGGVMCALGICMALLERSKSGKGQVIDASMVEGAAYLSTWRWKCRDMGPICYGRERGTHIFDSGAHFYQTYKTKDGKYIACGAFEPQFYELLLKGLQLDEKDVPHFADWEQGKKTFTDLFATKTRDEWMKIFESTDACVTPVLEADEAPLHPHNQGRDSFRKNSKGYHEPSPAPMLSRTPATPNFDEPLLGQHTREILTELGYSKDEFNKLIQEQTVKCTEDEPKSKL